MPNKRQTTLLESFKKKSRPTVHENVSPGHDTEPSALVETAAEASLAIEAIAEPIILSESSQGLTNVQETISNPISAPGTCTSRNTLENVAPGHDTEPSALVETAAEASLAIEAIAEPIILSESSQGLTNVQETISNPISVPGTSTSRNTLDVDTLLKPSQPRLSKYPVNPNVSSKRTRSFNPKWYLLFPWIEYNVELDAVFCYCCKKYLGSIDSPFTTTGYNKWHHAMDKNKGFSKHQDSEPHKTSYLKWVEHQQVQCGSEMGIDKRLVPNVDEIATENREYFSLIFTYIQWFLINEVAMKGHREYDDDPLHQGNWKSFIKLQIETNPTFKDLHVKMRSKRLATDYTSKTIVNEIISIMADECRMAIYEEIKTAGCFSALIDESKDNAKREELAFSVRYFLNDQVIERFICLENLTKFDAKSIADVTKKLIDKVQQNSSNAHIISLGADGASVMSGEFAGVAQRLRSEFFPWLLYIHCTAHRLNLLVNDLVKNFFVATDVMGFINSLYTLFNHAKVREEYESIFKEANPKAQIRYVTQQIEIRWACKFEGFDFLLINIIVIHTTLAKIVNSEKGKFNPKHVETADGLYHKLSSGKFIVSLVTLHNYLKELYYLSKELQAEKIDWTNVEFEITRTRQSLEKISDDMLLTKSQEVCDKLGVSLCLTLNLRIHNTRSAAQEAELNLNHVSKTVNTLNLQLKQQLKEEFDIRFDSKAIEVMKCLQCFDAGSKLYLDNELLTKFANHFMFINIIHSILEMETERAKEDFNLGIPINPNRVENLLKLITVKNTIATSTASVERAFSGMNRICSKVRSSLSPDNLSDSLCASMNRDILSNLNTNKLIDKWANMKSRRFIL